MTTREEYNRFVKLGIEKTSVRLQDAEVTGRLYEAMQAGKISQNAWESYVKRLKTENRIRKGT